MEIETDFRDLNLPVLIIRGDVDVCLSAPISKRVPGKIPNGRLIRIQTEGYSIQENESEQLVDIITHFFRGNIS